MDVGVASKSESTEESKFTQDSVPDKVFIDVLEPNRHDWVRYQPSTFTPSSYYDSQHIGDL